MSLAVSSKRSGVLRRRGRAATAVALSAVMLAASACSHVSGGRQADPAPSGSDCTVDKLPLKNDDHLTVGTDQPAYPPWFHDDNPNDGKGFEAGVAYEIAHRLGFKKSQVDWVKSSFNQTIGPGEKMFDIALGQISITKKRRENVDLSEPYYSGPQAVITTEGNKISGVDSLADLRGAKLGAQADSTSYSAITDTVKPKATPSKFDNAKQATKALEKRRIDGLVVDLPTATEMTSGQVEDGLMVGKLPASGDEQDSFGVVLDHGSKLTPCVNQTVKKMGSDGTLEKLQDRWLPTPKAPELT